MNQLQRGSFMSVAKLVSLPSFGIREIYIPVETVLWNTTLKGTESFVPPKR